MTDMDLGQMFLVYNQALIARSSSDILFFKQQWDDIEERVRWKQYHVIEARGFIYYIKGNVRIQITTDELIYFYLIDLKTLEPQLENVMYNYMNCTQMMFGSKVRYCITYKTNQRSFQVYTRKFWHNFKVNIIDENMEGSKAVEFEKLGIFFATKIDKVVQYKTEGYELDGELPIKLLASETREPNEVLALQKCQNEEYLAVISGKNLIGAEQKINQLFVYKLKGMQDGSPRFEQVGWVMLKNIPEYFTQCSLKFHFVNVPGTTDRQELIFANIKEIFKLKWKDMNNESYEVTSIYKIQQKLIKQPQYFTCNSD